MFLFIKFLVYYQNKAIPLQYIYVIHFHKKKQYIFNAFALKTSCQLRVLLPNPVTESAKLTRSLKFF